MNDFDAIAPFYDFLAKWVFGGTILKSQIAFLEQIRKDDQVLILGGGTGEILEYLKADVQVEYVECSYRMIQRAERRKTLSNVHFSHLAFEDWDSEVEYDFVICPFFLDLYSQENLSRVIEKIKFYLKPDGRLLVSDFEIKNTSWAFNILSKLMHLFFLIFAKVESQNLQKIDCHLREQGFSNSQEKLFYAGFIFSRVYKWKD